jgi:hypothetical protein
MARWDRPNFIKRLEPSGLQFVEQVNFGLRVSLKLIPLKCGLCLFSSSLQPIGIAERNPTQCRFHRPERMIEKRPRSSTAQLVLARG